MGSVQSSYAVTSQPERTHQCASMESERNERQSRVEETDCQQNQLQLNQIDRCNTNSSINSADVVGDNSSSSGCSSAGTTLTTSTTAAQDDNVSGATGDGKPAAAAATAAAKDDKTKQKINIFRLYRFAGPIDILLIVVGLMFSILLGTSLQFPFLFMMNLINDFSALKNCTDYAENVTDCYVQQRFNEAIQSMTVSMGVVGLVCCLSAYICTSLFTVVADRVTRKVRRLAFTNILRQHVGFFDLHFGGELNTRMTQDMVKFEIGIGSKMALIVAWLSTFVSGLVLCLIYGWQLTLFMCALLPVAAVVSGVTTRLMKTYSEREMSAYAKAGGVAEEALSNIRVVVAYAGQQKEVERYRQLLKNAWKISLKSAAASACGMGLPYFLTLFVVGATVFLSGRLLDNGSISPGFAMMLLSAMMVGLRAMGYAAAALEIVSDSQAAAFCLYHIIDAKTEIDSTSDAGKKLENFRGLIQFEDVHFIYPARPGVTVLQGLTLDIQPGQSAALVGPSGCGKSTTIQLLQRFYDPLKGKVCVDGTDVRELNIRWLRQQIGVVSQDPVLFATTIEDNIRFGNPDATFDEIQQAAKQADAHNFIVKLPQKYETVINEQGTQLSRGEKQRISLARALVRKPKILLLDECTSALDNKSEATVQAALDKAAKGRTTIIIAHRLSTVKDADVLCVVDKGVLAERGSHAELLAKKGIYHKLVSIQLVEEKDKETENEECDGDKKDDDILSSLHRGPSVISLKSWNSVNSMTSNKTHDGDFNTDFHQTDEEGVDEDIPTRSLIEIFKLNKEKWPFLLCGCIGGLAVGTTWPIYSVLISDVIKGSVENGHSLGATALAIVILGICSSIVCIFSVYLLRYFGETLAFKLRPMAYAAMLRQEVAWFDLPSNQVGSLTSKLADETGKVKMATGSTMMNFSSAISSITCTLVIALIFSWQLGLAVLPILPLTVVAGAMQGYFNTTYEYRSHKRMESSGRIASEAVDKIRTIASLTKEDYFLDKYMSHFATLRKEAYKRGNVIGISWAFMYFCQFSITIVIFGFGLWLVSRNMMKFQHLFGILAVTLTTCAEVGRANSNVPELTASATSASKLLQLLNRKPVIDVNDDTGLKPESCKGEVRLRDVGFCYPSRVDTVVLRSINVAASVGQCIGIVGPSGGGKTTIVQLIERFYDTLSGVVSLDGVDVHELNVNWVRSQMSIVLQEPILFAVSIAENIAYGDNSRTVTMDEIIEAAKAANIHNFIAALPDGYNTNVGNKGTQLSGGQKQRISIARALIRNPKILLLDDATSALDSHSESVVEEALSKARAGRTSIVIAHRLSSVVNADMILYVDRGRVLECGTHGELMAAKRRYYRLFQANLGNKSTSS